MQRPRGPLAATRIRGEFWPGDAIDQTSIVVHRRLTAMPSVVPSLPAHLAKVALAGSDFRVKGQPIELRPRFNGQVPQLVQGYRSRTVVTVISSRLSSGFVFVRTGVRGSRPSCRSGVVSDDLVRDVGD